MIKLGAVVWKCYERSNWVQWCGNVLRDQIGCSGVEML